MVNKSGSTPQHPKTTQLTTSKTTIIQEAQKLFANFKVTWIKNIPNPLKNLNLKLAKLFTFENNGADKYKIL